VLTTWMTLPADRYRTPDARRSFYDAAQEAIAAMPGVSATALATALPLGGAVAKGLILDGQVPMPNQAPPTVWTITVSEGYFGAIGVGLVRGRPFERRDGFTGYEAAIVNQRFAERFLSGRDPLGQRLQLSDAGGPAESPPLLTVVGVAPNVRQRTQAAEPDPMVYLPFAGAPPASSVLLLRGEAGTATLAPAVRETIGGIDSELPLYRTMPMDQALATSNWPGRVSEALLNSIAFVAVCLAGIGLYAVMAHAVLHRTREIGIRMALGAQRRRLVAIMARSAGIYLALGVVAGGGCVAGFTKLIDQGTGQGSSPFRLNDPLTFVGGIGILAVITGAAAIVPTWRVAQVDPARVLRES
jgi:putative ABC transport system permease protein